MGPAGVNWKEFSGGVTGELGGPRECLPVFSSLSPSENRFYQYTGKWNKVKRIIVYLVYSNEWQVRDRGWLQSGGLIVFMGKCAAVAVQMGSACERRKPFSPSTVGGLIQG